MKPSEMTPLPPLPDVVEGEVVEVSDDEAELWDAVILLWKCKVAMDNFLPGGNPAATRTLAEVNYFLTDWACAEEDAKEEMMGRKERQEL